VLSTGSPTDTLEFLMIALGVIFLLKRLADMDKHYELRLFVLTFILTLTVIVLFIGYGLSLADSYYAECPVDHYCQTEF
jgi:hypothetical protein